MAKIARRDFLKAAPAAASVVAYASRSGAMADAPAQTGNAPLASDPTIGTAAYVPVRDYPIRPMPYFDVTLADGFWKPKIATNAAVTIPLEVEKLTAAPRGLTGNVLEAAILSLRTHPNARLRAIVDARLQQLVDAPETGNSGYEVAATLYQATGRADLLKAAERAADALYADFVARNPPFSGGERDAINCVQLYRATHDKKHLDLAKHYLDIRGLPNSVNRSRHNQLYRPVLEQSEAVGHAVNGASLMVSLVDVGVLTGIHDYFDAAHRMWLDIVGRKMYITGGVGTTGNEGFGEGYSLPNISAYSETCAALMFITLNHRLFLATGDSQYIDVMERAMYNNAVAGVSSAGDRFFYVNRLSSAGDGRDARWERASLECCPPNLVRFLASMPGFIYGQDQQDRLYVNLYVTSETTFKTGRGEIRLAVQSGMPWSGQSTITVSAGLATAGSILLRIPGWSRNLPAPGGLYAYTESIDRPVTVSVNGTSVSAVPDKSGYVVLEREWKDGDTIRIEFPIEVRRVIADRRVVQNRGRIAVERGPIVYCSEWPDADGGRVLDRLFDRNGRLTPTVDRSLYGGVTVIDTEARTISNPSSAGRRVRLIPYSLWANRGAGEMSVWLSTAGYTIGDIGPAGGFIFYENPNYAHDGWRYLEAAPFDQSAGAKWGCFRRAIAGAHGTAVGTGRQNTLDMKTGCAEPGSASDLCASLTVNGVGGWFLPARDELALMYRNLKVPGLGDFHDGGVADNFSYWTSSQQTADMAAHIDFADLGRQHGDDKDFPRRVRAIRAI